MPECIRCLIMVKSEGKEHDERQSTRISSWRVVSLMDCALSVPKATQVTSGLEPSTFGKQLKLMTVSDKGLFSWRVTGGSGLSSLQLSVYQSSNLLTTFWHICRQQVKHNIELLSLNICWQRQTLRINHQSTLNVPEVPQAQKQMWKIQIVSWCFTETRAWLTNTQCF